MTFMSIGLISEHSLSTRDPSQSNSSMLLVVTRIPADD